MVLLERDRGTSSKSVCNRQCLFILARRKFSALITEMSNVTSCEVDFSSLEHLGDKNASGTSACQPLLPEEPGKHVELTQPSFPGDVFPF